MSYHLLTGVAVFLFFAFSYFPSLGKSLQAEPIEEVEVASYFVRLDRPSCSQALKKIPKYSPSSLYQETARKQFLLIQEQQQKVCSSLEALGCNITGRFAKSTNAIRILASREEAKQALLINGVLSIEVAKPLERSLGSSVPFIGTPTVWSSAQNPLILGQGMRIGIIDSGIDYHHLNFGGNGKVDYDSNDPAIIEPGSFPTAKVVGGYDFVGDSYNADSDTTSTPNPDPDPLDPSENGHGTSVASVAAGLGVTKSASTYGGSYGATLNFDQFQIGPGVAPQASLYALKVFGREGSTNAVVDALEWALDPNDDMDFSDCLDVVNASLGADFGRSTAGLTNIDIYQEVISALTDHGCIVVTSAGNSGNTALIVESPAATSSAIAVANSIHQGFSTHSIQVPPPSIAAGEHLAIDGAFTLPLSETSGITKQLILANPPTACSELSNFAQLSGNIALINRGGCRFDEKIKRAQDAGAVAVVIANHRPGNPFAMTGESEVDGVPITIPAVMVSRDTGVLLSSALLETTSVTLGGTIATTRPEFIDTISGSSSRGPSSGTIAIKPEISAPGTNIVTARAGSGLDSKTVSGTSFSAPHVAGAAALLRQKHPDWPVTQIKAALMNTAVPIQSVNGYLYPVARVGAGRLDIAMAGSSEVTAMANDDTGLVGLSFGAITASQPASRTKEVLLTNHGSSAKLFEVSVETIQPNLGASLTVPQSVLIPAGGDSIIPIILHADPSKFGEWYDPTSSPTLGFPETTRHLPVETSGYLVFSDGPHSIQLPYYALLREGLSETSNLSEIALTPGINKERFHLPTSSPGTSRTSPISAFELLVTDENLDLEQETLGSGDIIAIGVASDYDLHRDVASTRLYFALVTAAPLETPSPLLSYTYLNLSVDDEDTREYALTFASQGSISPETMAAQIFFCKSGF